MKQRKKLKNINEKLEEVLNRKDGIDLEIITHKKLDKLIYVKKKKLAHKFNKMLDTNLKDNFNIRQKDKEENINPIQDGLFQGCSRMGGGGDGPPP